MLLADEGEIRPLSLLIEIRRPVMGSLITETPWSEITATIEIFDLFGVGRDDLRKFRAASKEVQGHMVGMFKTADSISAAPQPAMPFDTIIRVDRSIRPVYPDWMKRVMHPDLETTGPSEFDLAGLEQWLLEKQKKGVVRGTHIYKHLKSNTMLEGCLGLRDLQEIQKKGIAVFRKFYSGKAVFGWKSVVLNRDGRLFVPCLIESGGEVALYWRWLGNVWYSISPALRFAS